MTSYLSLLILDYASPFLWGYLCSYLILKTLSLWFNKNSHKKQPILLPPGPRKWPIFGNLLQLGQLPHRDLAALCDKYGPLVYIRLGRVDAITTNDPDIIREILRQQDDVFASRPRTLAAERLAYGCGDVALAPLGPKWKRLRRICMEHLLTTKRLESFASHRADEAQHLVKDVWAMAQKGEVVNLREVLGAFSMNNVTRMLLGKQYFGAESAGPQEALEFMHITHELFWLLGLIYLGDYLPIWRWVDPFGCEKKMREVEKRVDDFHAKIIEEHRKRRGNQETCDEGEMDFVDVLLSLPGENGKQHMDDVEIKALMQTSENEAFTVLLQIIVSSRQLLQRLTNRSKIFCELGSSFPSVCEYAPKRKLSCLLTDLLQFDFSSLVSTQIQLAMFLRRAASKLRPLPSSKFFSNDRSHDLSKVITELNQEMESVFGEPPASSSLDGSVDNQTIAQESHIVTNDVTQKDSSPKLTHISSKGEAQMVDITSKEITKRVAIASCKVILGQKVFDLVSANQMQKGDVLGVAKIAGVCGAKQTSHLIPLCHNINLSHVRLDLRLNPHDVSVEIEGEAACSGKTGVEMEALTAVTVAGLTVYDMCKAASKDIVITDVRLEQKSGGKSGDWSRQK
ncbi:hypothetical protein BUALT_Bualt01G0240400 [Buddleja alternifolia]|uniref:cyclic pyranopterin monophosphate synthase n=1 Tax=Buddleja alternifolia TaxID=168488 RepID=A0AAV6YG76_9LAMI|nr:hypothetical protein BUALT_Bualt01G0240400 [Buddleja alternifolia]